MVSNLFKRVGFVGLAITMFSSILAGLLTFAKPVKAQTQQEYGVSNIDKIEDAIDYLEWIDAAHIKLKFKTGQELVFTPSENLRDERLSGKTGYGVNNGKVSPAYACNKEVRFDINENNGGFEKQSTQLKKANVDIDFKKDADSDCEDGNEPDIEVRKPELSIAYFKWTAPNQIGTVDGEFPGSFTKGTTEVTIEGVKYQVFLSDRESNVTECRDKLILNPLTNQIKWYELGSSSDGDPPNDISPKCGYNDEDDKESFPRNNYLWVLANTADIVKDQPPSTGQPGEDTNDPAAQECEDLAGNFGVIACWILKGVDGFLNMIENIIASQLEVKADLYSAEGNGKGVYEAWRSVARISSALIAIISLVMVLGTALGDYKAFSPYTVKRVLPRLVIAAIAIWLSWPLATAYINLMNILGKGIADILWSPFVAGAGDFNSYGLAEAMKDKSGLSQALTNFSVVGALATAGLAASGGVFALISSLIPILIFMLVGFAVLVLRQALIIFLLVLAPVAIVAWVLPNTESIWKKWSKLFNQLLIMFPMFMGILAAGKIFSYINSSSGGNDFFNIIISVIGYVTPFVLLPGIFKSAGGALSKVTGALNKQGSKYGGKLSGVTDNQAKIRKNAITSNNRLNALQNIGKPDRGVVGGFMDRRRVGMPIGVGFRSGSRDALSKQRERIGAAGKEEYKKAQRELVDNELKTLRENNTDRASLTDIVQNGGSTHVRQAALERLIETRAETEVRGLMNGSHAKEEFKKVINDGTLRSAFSDTAPDIGRAIVDTDGSIKTNDMLTAGKLPDASTIAGWTKTTLGVALEDDGNKQTILDMVERNPDFAESLNQEKLDEINKAVYRLRGGVLDPDGKVPPGTPQQFTPARQQKA